MGSGIRSAGGGGLTRAVEPRAEAGVVGARVGAHATGGPGMAAESAYGETGQARGGEEAR